MGQEAAATAQLERSLEEEPPVLRALTMAIQKLIGTELPGVEEKLNPWHVYSFKGRDYFCYLAVSSRHVSLGFLKGTSLSDLGRLLEGTGKNLRHVKFRKVEDLDRPGLRELIAEAVELDRKKG
ncbi:MAG TPA: DUF1801 domain-containing protein [Candidatus Dormibacteraeota bacterium]|nr:DUF1801 domain-containing protein [Candidatus Dormibacteraeota bacterium]